MNNEKTQLHIDTKTKKNKTYPINGISPEQFYNIKQILKRLDRSLIAAGVKVNCPIRDNNYM